MGLKLLLVGEPCVAPLTHEWPCVGQKVLKTNRRRKRLSLTCQRSNYYQITLYLLKGKSAGQASDTAKVTAVSLPQLRFGSDR